MSVRFLVCDGCGRQSDEVALLVAFEHYGMSVHLCDECVNVAKELVDKRMEAVDVD